LHHRTNAPESADAEGEPHGQGMRRGCQFASESPRQRSENRERDRYEINMDLENFSNEQGGGSEIALPFHDPNQKEIEDRNTELGERANPEKEFKVIEE
jgi:hypothetical protein